MVQTSFQWGAFLIFAFVQCATPGPNVVLLTGSGSTWGFRRSLPHLLGVCLGFPLMFLIVQLGAGETFRHAPWLFSLLTVLSLLYVVWLALRIFRMGFRENAKVEAGSRPMTFGEAVLFQWVNGKAWQMVLMAATIYPSPDLGTKVSGALVFVVLLLVTGSLWVEVGKRIARFLENPSVRRVYYSVLAASLLVSTVPAGISQLRAHPADPPAGFKTSVGEERIEQSAGR